MKRYSINLIVISLVSFCLFGCKNVGTTKVSATGSIYECLVVIPEGVLTEEQLSILRENHIGEATGSAYDEPIGTVYELVKATLGAPMPCLPQIEPYFKVSSVTPELFDAVLAPSRNILFVDITPIGIRNLKPRPLRMYGPTLRRSIRFRVLPWMSLCIFGSIMVKRCEIGS